MIKCSCGLDSVWVENVPGKGYNFCSECRAEVMHPSAAGIPDVSNTELLDVAKLFEDLENEGDIYYNFWTSLP